jgi:hypothetical protein
VHGKEINMTAKEIKQLKKDYDHISAVLEILEKTVADFDQPVDSKTKWNAHQREYQTRSYLKRIKKEYGEKLIGTIS